MAEHYILIAEIIAAFLFGLFTLKRKSTESRKWAAGAFAGMFVYLCMNYIIPFIAEETAFIFLKEASLIASGLFAAGYILSVAALSKVEINKNIFNGFIGISGLFVIAVASMRLYGTGFSGISFGGPDSDFRYTVTYKAGLLYSIMTYIYAAVLLALAVYCIAMMFRSSEKTNIQTKLSALVGVLLPVLIINVLPSDLITNLVMTAAGALLFATVATTDHSDVVEFGKSTSINNISDGIIIFRGEKQFLFANRTAKRLFAELSDNDSSKAGELLASLTDNAEIKRADHIYSITKTTYTDYTGKCDCTVINAHDVTEQHLKTDRLAEEAAFDSITGVSSRSVAVNTLTELCETGEGTLMIISFDGFKAINSVYGHEEANELLKTFGTLLKNNTNTDDIRGRFGGENFVIFLKNCSSESVIANLTMRLEEQALTALKKQLGDSVSISVGVSAGAVFVPKFGRDFEALAGYAEAERDRIAESGGHGYGIYNGERIEKIEEPVEELTFPSDDAESETPAETEAPAEIGDTDFPGEIAFPADTTPSDTSIESNDEDLFEEIVFTPDSSDK